MYRETKCGINDFTKQLLMEDNKLIKSFIRNYEGGQGDEENFENLIFEINCNKLGIPTEIQAKINNFIEANLEPMVYEADTVFAKSRSAGRIVDGVQHIDTEEDTVKMIAGFYEVLTDVESKWDKFTEEELKPYIV